MKEGIDEYWNGDNSTDVKNEIRSGLRNLSYCDERGRAPLNPFPPIRSQGRVP